MILRYLVNLAKTLSDYSAYYILLCLGRMLCIPTALVFDDSVGMFTKA